MPRGAPGTALPGTSAPLVRRRLGREQRRLQIVDAARSVFVEHGYGGARVQLIAERAEITEALLYQHFASKEALFEAAVLEPLESMINELADPTRAALGEQSSPERLRSYAEMHEIVARTCIEIVPLLGVALFSANGPAFYRERLVPVLERAYYGAGRLLESGNVPHPLDGRTVFMMTFGMHLGLALDAYMRGEDLDIRELSPVLADVVARGLSLAHQPAAASATTGKKRNQFAMNVGAEGAPR